MATNNMNQRYFVTSRTKEQIRLETIKTREIFGLGNQTNFDISELVSKRLPELISEFNFLVVRDGDEDIQQEGITEFSTSKINMQIRRDVFTNAKLGDGRSRFTIAHELGHFALHKAFFGAAMARDNVYFINGKNGDKFRDAEWQANTFASYFLMPDDLVRNYESAEDLMLDFGVSMEAAKIRFEQIKMQQPREIPDHIKSIINDFKRNNGFEEI